MDTSLHRNVIPFGMGLRCLFHHKVRCRSPHFKIKSVAHQGFMALTYKLFRLMHREIMRMFYMSSDGHTRWLQLYPPMLWMVLNVLLLSMLYVGQMGREFRF